MSVTPIITKKKNRNIAMVTQKAISLKIDTELLEDLDTEASRGWRKRNGIINDAIRYYLKLKDARRLYKAVIIEKNQEEVLNSFLREQFPEAATW